MVVCGFFQGFPLLVLLGIFQAVTAWSSTFNTDSCKPHQWGWKAQKNNFENAPRILCPIRNLWRCICKNDLRKSRYLVDCEHVFTQKRIYRLQAPRNATHFRATSNRLLIIASGSFTNATRLIYLDL